jgi:hypothetical protein
MSDPEAKSALPANDESTEDLVHRAGRDLNRFSDSYGLVFLLIVATLLSTALASDVRWGRVLTALLMALTLLLTFHASHVMARRRWHVVGGVAALLVVAAAAALSGDGTVNRLPALVIAAGFVVAASLAIVHRLRRQSSVTMRTVMGALCIYLFIGFFFAIVFTAVALVDEGAFFAQTDTPDGVEFVYFSFITQATVGYGDLSPVTDLGRMLAITQALLGQVYLVTIVAALVSNLGRARPGESGRSDAPGEERTEPGDDRP